MNWISKINNLHLGHTDRVYSLAELKDGTLASGSWDFSIRIWNQNNGSLIRTLLGHTDRVYSLAVLDDASLVSGSGDTTIRVWNVTTGLCLRILTGHSDWVYSLAVLPQNRLSSGSGTDDLGEIKIWNMNNGWNIVICKLILIFLFIFSYIWLI